MVTGTKVASWSYNTCGVEGSASMLNGFLLGGGVVLVFRSCHVVVFCMGCYVWSSV